VDYRDVEKDPGLIHEMTDLTKGRRKVPVIVRGSKITVGYGGT